jgi:hypothetical protein
MELAQQKRDKREGVSIDELLYQFEPIRHLANLKETDELLRSEPGHPDPKKWTTAVLARRLQLPEATIRRYARSAQVTGNRLPSRNIVRQRAK